MQKIRRVQKRGISPVIATMLLVSIALVLAIIIFLWARAFLTERIQKDMGGGPELIESFCKDVNFEAEAFSEDKSQSYVNGRTFVRIVNRGNVPIHALEIRKKDATKQTIQLLGVGTFYRTTTDNQPRRTVANGEDGEVSIDCKIPSTPEINPCPVEKDATLTVVPIILGQKGTQYAAHVCDTEFAKETKVR